VKFFTNQKSSGNIEVTRLDIENFNDDIEQIKINQTCHEVDSVYNEYEKDFVNVLNKHKSMFSWIFFSIWLQNFFAF
jgi:hypothetical protein